MQEPLLQSGFRTSLLDISIYSFEYSHMRSGSKLDYEASAIPVFATFMPIAERVADHPCVTFDVVLELMDVAVNPDVRSPGLDDISEITGESSVGGVTLILVQQ